MNIRKYNIYFHTHTISGIIISAILYIIFFAGSFSFFRQEISDWQKNTPAVAEAKINFNIDKLTDSLNHIYGLYGRNLTLSYTANSPQIYVSLSASKDSSNKLAGTSFNIDAYSHKSNEESENYTLGEFLYRLHFLEQLNNISGDSFPLGYYLSGAVAFIFLFATITGVLLHWNKIVSDFYLFRPWEKLKTVCTDLHTALGMLTLPFLFVFALTGSYFCISDVFSSPVVKYQYRGDNDKYYNDLGYTETNISFKNLRQSMNPSYFIHAARQKEKCSRISEVTFYNYGDAGMQVHIKTEAARKDKFVSNGEIVFDASKKILSYKPAIASTGYSFSMQEVFYRLHFGNYGGYLGKITNFLLGVAGCVVIMSGVYIWLIGRDKKNIPAQKRKFNKLLANIYIAVASSMYPVTALAFIIVKMRPHANSAFINQFYFIAWLVLTCVFTIRGNIYKTNRDCLLTGSILAFFIPVVNGIVTNNSLWDNIAQGYSDLAFIDLFWILSAIATFIGWYLMVSHHRKKNGYSIRRSSEDLSSDTPAFQ